MAQHWRDSKQVRGSCTWRHACWQTRWPNGLPSRRLGSSRVADRSPCVTKYRSLPWQWRAWCDIPCSQSWQNWDTGRTRPLKGFAQHNGMGIPCSARGLLPHGKPGFARGCFLALVQPLVGLQNFVVRRQDEVRPWSRISPRISSWPGPVAALAWTLAQGRQVVLDDSQAFGPT